MAGKEEGFFEDTSKTVGNLVEAAGDGLGAVSGPAGAIPTALGNIAQGGINFVGGSAQVASDLVHLEFGEAARDALGVGKDLVVDTVGGIASTAVAATGMGALNVAADAAGYVSRSGEDKEKEDAEKKVEAEKKAEEKKAEEKKKEEEKEPSIGQMIMAVVMTVVTAVIDALGGGAADDAAGKSAPDEQKAPAIKGGANIAQNDPQREGNISPELAAEARATVNGDIQSRGEAESAGVQAHVTAPERDTGTGVYV